MGQDKNIVSAVRNNVNSLYEEFKQKAEAISARVYRVQGCPEAAREIARIIKELKINKIAVELSPLTKKLNLESSFSGSGAGVCVDDLRRQAVGADMGISTADLAIAETGTLVRDATAMEGRLVSMLPPVHLAVISTESLVPTLRDALDRYNNNLGTLPSYLTFISGPSRTADIERVLTIGVHGPGELHIIFIDNPGGEAR